MSMHHAQGSFLSNLSKLNRDATDGAVSVLRPIDDPRSASFRRSVLLAHSLETPDEVSGVENLELEMTMMLAHHFPSSGD